MTQEVRKGDRELGEDKVFNEKKFRPLLVSSVTTAAAWRVGAIVDPGVVEPSVGYGEIATADRDYPVRCVIAVGVPEAQVKALTFPVPHRRWKRTASQTTPLCSVLETSIDGMVTDQNK